jgi:hypothetical protein
MNRLNASFPACPHKPNCSSTWVWSQPLAVSPSFDRTDSRYPILTQEDLEAASPDCILLSSEPFPFKQWHVDYFQKILPNAYIALVDGEMFSWYGSRLLKFNSAFASEVIQSANKM